jgi:hypothetical protein
MKNPEKVGNFRVYPASVSGFMAWHPVSGKTGKFIMFLYPIASTGTSPD